MLLTENDPSLDGVWLSILNQCDLTKWLSNHRQVAKQSGYNVLFFIMKMKRFSFSIIKINKNLQQVGICNKESHETL